jgi:hypothetical protein
MKRILTIILCFIISLAAYGVDLTVGSNVGAAGTCQNVIHVSLANDVTVRGVQLDLTDDPDLLVPDSVVVTERTENFTIVPQDNEGVLTILLLSLDGTTIQPDSGEIFKVYFSISPDAQHGQELDLIVDNSVIVHKEEDQTIYLPVTVNNGKFYIQNTTDVGDEDAVKPSDYALMQNYPNPFNPATTISFSLPGKTHVMLNIYNTIGQLVRTLVNRSFQPGKHQVVWNGHNDAARELPAGVYYYQLITADIKMTKKLILVR